jgi:hypothetical protein
MNLWEDVSVIEKASARDPVFPAEPLRAERSRGVILRVWQSGGWGTLRSPRGPSLLMVPHLAYADAERGLQS